MIEVNNLEYSIENENHPKKKILFLNESISFEDQKIHLITGPSGSGKSTFLKCLGQLIHLNSKGILKAEIKNPFNANEIGYLFQNPFNQIIHLNTKHELAFYAENKKIEFNQYSESINALLKKFNLENLLQKNTQDLSHGEAQKLLLISILVSQPKVLFLDEPTAFLDPESRKSFYILLEQLKKTTMIFLVDHHLKEVGAMADTYVHIDLTGHIHKISKQDFQHSQRASEVETKFLHQSFNFKYKIEVQSLYYRMKDKSVLENVNLTFQSGEVILLKGANGSGKSTFFKILAGYLKTSQGQVKHFDEMNQLNQKKINKNIGFVTQNSDDNFFFDTLEEELNATGVNPYRDSILKNINLSQSPFLLSEGEKRRAALAVQVSLNKKVIFYDEPTYGQDGDNKKYILKIINQLSEQGVLQFIISHDEDFINQVASRIFEIKDKKIVEVGLNNVNRNSN